MASFKDCGGMSVVPDVVVSQHGKGNYLTLKDAVMNIPQGIQGQYVIYIQAGFYEENVTINRSNITIVGDGKGRTVIRSRRSAKGTGIKFSGALVISGNNCIVKCLTIENVIEDDKGQAAALCSEGNKNAFYRCEFKGFQDTLFVSGMKDEKPPVFGKQFFRECDISGTVDFIFGDAQVVLEKCDIKFRRRLQSRSSGYAIAASGRKIEASDTAIVIHCCNISSEFPMDAEQKGWLGRAWKTHARMVVINSTIADVIIPAGWTNMSNTDYSKTAEITEYGNRGRGASTSGRVKWPKYKASTNPADVLPFTVESFIDGKEWLPATGVPFDLGLNC